MTKRATAQTFNSEREYRYLKKPAYPGQLRLKTWPYIVVPRGPNDPEWLKRAIDFWKLQAETYGLRFEPDVQVLVDYQSGCVTTAVHVAEVLPGRRSRDFVTPRVAEQRIKDAMVRSDEELLQ